MDRWSSERPSSPDGHQVGVEQPGGGGSSRKVAINTGLQRASRRSVVFLGVNESYKAAQRESEAENKDLKMDLLDPA